MQLMMCLRQCIDGDSKSLSLGIDMGCGQTSCATSVWISGPTKYCEILSDICAVWRHALPPKVLFPKTNKLYIFCWCDPSKSSASLTDCDWLMNLLSPSALCVCLCGGENLKWIESISVRCSATIYRKAHQIKIYVLAVVTWMVCFTRTDEKKNYDR